MIGTLVLQYLYVKKQTWTWNSLDLRLFNSWFHQSVFPLTNPLAIIGSTIRGHQWSDPSPPEVNGINWYQILRFPIMRIHKWYKKTSLSVTHVSFVSVRPSISQFMSAGEITSSPFSFHHFHSFSLMLLVMKLWFMNLKKASGSHLFQSNFLKPGTGADSGPGVFNDFYFKHYVWICLKLWRRDDFVILPRIRNVVFVPRYARNLFIDHWILIRINNWQMWILENETSTAFEARLFSFMDSAFAFADLCAHVEAVSFQVLLVVPTIGEGTHLYIVGSFENPSW